MLQPSIIDYREVVTLQFTPTFQHCTVKKLAFLANMSKRYKQKT